MSEPNDGEMLDVGTPVMVDTGDGMKPGRIAEAFAGDEGFHAWYYTELDNGDACYAMPHEVSAFPS